MKPKATISKTVDDDGVDVWRYERPTFGFSRFDVVRQDFATWREAIHFAQDRPLAGRDGHFEQAFEGTDGIGPRARWTPLWHDDEGKHRG